jgi:hypothetical protein
MAKPQMPKLILQFALNFLYLFINIILLPSYLLMAVITLIIAGESSSSIYQKSTSEPGIDKMSYSYRQLNATGHYESTLDYRESASQDNFEKSYKA